MACVKWAVLGAGGIARRRTIPEGIVPASNGQLAAVYDPACGPEVAEQFGARACTSEAELLAQDCEVVYVATPVHFHVEQVCRAAEAGKHVFCEKPLGRNVAEAEQMARTCTDAGMKLGVGLLMRFHACHREALRLLRAGAIGRPVLGRAQLSCWYPPLDGAWRQDPDQGGGGSVMDMGCHCIDLLEMFLGRTRRVACLTGHLVHDYRSEDSAGVMLEHASGALGMVDTLFSVPDECVRNRLELYGSSGSILAEGTIGQEEAGRLVLSLRTGEAGYDAQQQRESGGCRELSPAPVNTYRAEVEAFSQAVLDDAPPPVSGEDGVWNQRVLAACYESARTGRFVGL